MNRRRSRSVGSQDGLAMVLAVSFIAVLSAMAVWMILQSKSSMQATKAYERTEASMRLAEGALWRIVGVTDNQILSLPATDSNSTDNVTSEARYEWRNYLRSPAPLTGGGMTPTIYSNRQFYNTVTTAWQLPQGTSGGAFCGLFYEGDGDGSISFTGSTGSSPRGIAHTRMYNFLTKVGRCPQ